MKLVCIDTQIVQWALLAEPGHDARDEVLRARQLFDEFQEDKVRIIIPAIVLGELLVAIDEDRHDRVVQAFHKRFVIAPYDALAASIAGRMRRMNSKEVKTLKYHPEHRRVRIAIDHQVLAVAMAQNADVLYTDDGDFTSLASQHIKTLGLPELKETQLPLRMESTTGHL